MTISPVQIMLLALSVVLLFAIGAFIGFQIGSVI